MINDRIQRLWKGEWGPEQINYSLVGVKRSSAAWVGALGTATVQLQKKIGQLIGEKKQIQKGRDGDCTAKIRLQ